MTPQEMECGFVQFLNISAAYYVMQLIRCALFSYAVFALVCFLRKTIFKNRVFLKSASWSLLIPVLFIGRMKFFYENIIGIRLFSWVTQMCMNHIWICRLYLCGVLAYALLLFHRKRTLKMLVTQMEKRMVGDTVLYITDAPITPSAIGVFRSRIVMPKVILNEYDREEFQTILLHEKTHIRLGHLLFYFLWDILRVLLWINPFLAMGVKFFRQDMEEICDWVTIRESGKSAYEYGQLLIKCVRLLQAESDEFNMYATFAGGSAYADIRQRVTRIVRYEPYKKISAFCVTAVVVLCMIGAVVGIHTLSYGRYNPDNEIVLYDVESGTFFDDDSEALGDIIRYDDDYLYIHAEDLRKWMESHCVSGKEFHIYFGGYYKLPGMGGSGSVSYLERADLETGILKMEYTKQEDILDHILKWL